jgi:hypothetical protein
VAKLIFVRERSKKRSPRYLLRNFILKKSLSGVIGLTSEALKVVYRVGSTKYYDELHERWDL